MTKYIKNIVKKYFVHFAYFHSHLRHRIFMALSLSLVVGVLDGFGLAMFFPLLEMIGENKTISGDGLGGLDFLIRGIASARIPLNIYSVLIIIAVFFVLKGIAKFYEQYYNVITQQYFIKRLRYESVNKLSNLKYKAFVTSDVGRIQNTLTGEVGRVSQAYRNYFLAVQSGVLVGVYIILALLTDTQFATLVIIGGGLSNLVYNRIYRKTKVTSGNITKGGHIFQGLLIQQVAFFKYLKATGYIHRYAKKLKDTIDYIEQNTKRIGLYNAILAASREPLVIIVVVSVIVIQVSFFSENIGAIVLSLMFFYRSLNALMQLQNYWNSFLNMSGSLTNITTFMKELAGKQERITGEVFDQLKSGIKLKGVQFSYDDTQILADINISIPKDHTVAFIGESGSGKTTLVNIIAGLMPVENGSVFIDGKPFDTIDTVSFQKRIGYITQEPVIFSDTIFNNVTFWDEDIPANRTRFWTALEKAAIADFVRNLPQQEDSVLGNNGILISGGQKQRLSIARELYKEVDMLIMDEATSALDSETERAIQENIEALKGKFTILIVAHRLSTIKNADLIILLKNGSIQGMGNYELLIDTSSEFKKMVALQEI